MKSKLIEMREKYPQTELWTDSFHTADHAYGLTQGITGITTSPTWVSRMLCNEEGSEHEKILCELQGKHPEYNEQEMIWAWTLEMGKRRSRVMLPLWEQGNPKQGRFSIQTSIYDYSNTEKMVRMAEEVNSCGPNMQVKIPSTKEGIKAMEEATFKGISVMATVCFSVDQAVAAAEAANCAGAVQCRFESGVCGSIGNAGGLAEILCGEQGYRHTPGRICMVWCGHL